MATRNVVPSEHQHDLEDFVSRVGRRVAEGRPRAWWPSIGSPMPRRRTLQRSSSGRPSDLARMHAGVARRW